MENHNYWFSNLKHNISILNYEIKLRGLSLTQPILFFPKNKYYLYDYLIFRNRI